MAPIRRRSTLIGMGTIVFGASGFIASGAFELGSQESTGSDWVRVASIDNPVEAEETEIDGGDTSESDGEDDEEDEEDDDDSVGSGGSDDDETDEDGGSDDEEEEELEEELEEEELEEEELEEETKEEEALEEEDDEDDDGSSGGGSGGGPSDDPDPVETRIQVVTDPSNENNLVGQIDWSGRMTESDSVVGNEDGFLERFSVANANKGAVSRVGFVDENGYPTDRIAFLVSNVGNPDTPGNGGFPVELELELYDEDGSAVDPAGQIRFPYRVVTPGGGVTARGTDLREATVDLPVAHVVETVIEIDSRQGTDALERVAYVDFPAAE
ncbi:hypothetical protein [Natrarchaeobius halalkaliphilus]|uniref:hypothetical protein n=1 Tax=Natrarchaeobius halalkaliphilus TaxID=1679091 RepID=UPI0014050A0F|nr:hypothetical protein [Natrarchaeobius halalkaliphilus]